MVTHNVMGKVGKVGKVGKSMYHVHVYTCSYTVYSTMKVTHIIMHTDVKYISE